MKINVEIDLTPEELRRFMGLPDVGDWQKLMLENFTQSIQNSQGAQEEFVKDLLTSSFSTWQSLFMPFANQAAVGTSQTKKDG